MDELTVLSSSNDVRKPNSSGTAVGRNLHQATGLHETTQGSKEQVHQILVPPSHKWMTIEKTRHVLKPRIHSQPGAIHVVKHFSVFTFKLLHSCIDFGIPLSKYFDCLKCSGHNSPHVAQCLSMLCQEDGEGKIGISNHKGISAGIYELQTVEPAAGQHPWFFSSSFLCSVAHLPWNCFDCFLQKLRD
eukprot:s2982_g1.t1